MTVETPHVFEGRTSLSSSHLSEVQEKECWHWQQPALCSATMIDHVYQHLGRWRSATEDRRTCGVTIGFSQEEVKLIVQFVAL